VTRPEDDSDEFAEFYLTEDQFDAIMARGEPARLVPPPRRQAGRTLYFALVPGAPGEVTEPESWALRELVP
jgi:hypothetical protein